MNQRLQDKVAIITGAAQGIGYATARKFLDEGAKVIACDISRASIDAALASLSSRRAIDGVVVDVTVREQIDAMTAATVQRHGRVDVLVNNAGITLDARLQKMTEDPLQRGRVWVRRNPYPGHHSGKGARAVERAHTVAPPRNAGRHCQRVCVLASDEASYINGAVIEVSGGLTV